MEEIVTLQYVSFAALSQWAEVVTLIITGHLKIEAEQALRGQLFLDELRMEQPSWKTI